MWSEQADIEVATFDRTRSRYDNKEFPLSATLQILQTERAKLIEAENIVREYSQIEPVSRSYARIKRHYADLIDKYNELEYSVRERIDRGEEC
jgi:predicted transcriptional regulator